MCSNEHGFLQFLLLFGLYPGTILLMAKKSSEISPFEYGDYRQFLRDWYAHAKKTRPHFSYRSFAKKAGLQTSNFLMLVIKGKRNLTENSLANIIKGLELNKQEQEFFRNLVFFNQSKTPEQQSAHYERLVQSKKFGELKPIEKQHHEYYSHWYNPVIREMAVAKDFDGSPEWLSARLYPEVTAVQCAKSLALLERLGFIKKIANGKWQQENTILSTGPEVSSPIIHNYHKTILNLTQHLMDRLPAKTRDVSTLTLGIKKERYAELLAKIREFRKDILKLVSQDTSPEQVVQLNLQFYSLTQYQKGEV